MSKSPIDSDTSGNADRSRQTADGIGRSAQTMLMAGVALVLIALGFIIWLVASGRGAAPGNETAAAGNAAVAATPAMPNRGRLLPSGLRIETIREGSGPLVARGDTPLIRYELRVLGREGVIESNFDQPQPIPMSLDGVIPGFAEALTLMRAGGEARFWVPPDIGYGAEPRPGAPFGPNDILEFRVRVERIVPAGSGTGAPGNAAEASPSNRQAATERPNGR